MLLQEIECLVFACDQRTGEVFRRRAGKAFQVRLGVNNPIVLEEEVEKNFLAMVSDGYTRFRKGVGYKAEVHRITFHRENRGRYYFMAKNKARALELSEASLRYVYPLVLASDLREEGFFWSGNYLLFPYRHGSVKVLSQEVLKSSSPEIYAYFKENEEALKSQSKYNSRIQRVEEFYGLIRVGRYTYADWYVCMRDNTKPNPCVVGKVKTHWGEEKMPLFDYHVNYLGFAEREKALQVWQKLKTLEPVIKALFDERSFGARLPFKLL